MFFTFLIERVNLVSNLFLNSRMIHVLEEERVYTYLAEVGSPVRERTHMDGLV